MVSFPGFLIIYTLGGVTFLPLLALVVLVYIKGGIVPVLATLQPKQSEPIDLEKDPDHVIVKKGWIRVISQYQPKMPEFSSTNGGIISGIQSYVGNNDNNSTSENRLKKGVVYGVLKHGTLFCFDSEKQKQVTMILPMQDYQVSLFAPSIDEKTDGELYNKTTVIRLTPNGLAQKKEVGMHTLNSLDSFHTLYDDNITCDPKRILYLTCARNIDKEDWYFGLTQARHMLHETQKEGPQYEMIDSTHFNPLALKKLISQVQSSPSHRETAWLNASIGRLFLSMYKTERLEQLFETKIRTKIERAKKPTFLDEIKVRNVDVGDSVPYITEPKLLSLSAQGELIVEAKVDYRGGLTVEIETDFHWSYSSRMKPIRMHVILAVKLKKFAGRMMFKLKAPPTNRYWTGFFEMPEMELKITPIVADKQIKLNIVTNAIESRIREVMNETMVLPNMSDTVFCPSDGRGGIFGEYQKVHVKPVQTYPELFYGGHETTRKNSEKVRKDSITSLSADSKRNSITESIEDNPTFPDSPGKLRAADALKLKNRPAETAAALSTNTSPLNDLSVPIDPLELNRAGTLDTSDVNVNDNVFMAPNEQPFFDDIVPKATGSKWPKGKLRRRSNIFSVDEDSEDEKGSNGIFNKISNLLPSEAPERTTPDATSVKSHSSKSSKRERIMNMAETFLTKKSDDKKDRRLPEPRKNISTAPPPLPPVKSEPPLKTPSRARANTLSSLKRPPLPSRNNSSPAIEVGQ